MQDNYRRMRDRTFILREPYMSPYYPYICLKKKAHDDGDFFTFTGLLKYEVPLRPVVYISDVNLEHLKTNPADLTSVEKIEYKTLDELLDVWTID